MWRRGGGKAKTGRDQDEKHDQREHPVAFKGSKTGHGCTPKKEVDGEGERLVVSAKKSFVSDNDDTWGAWSRERMKSVAWSCKICAILLKS